MSFLRSSSKRLRLGGYAVLTAAAAVVLTLGLLFHLSLGVGLELGGEDRHGRDRHGLVERVRVRKHQSV